MEIGKIGVIFLMVLLFASCRDTKMRSDVPAEIIEANFDWLLGDWERTNNEKGKITQESWSVNEDGSYIGKGLTFHGEDTISSELMVISKGPIGYKLDVSFPSDSIPTSFDLVDIKSSSFTCTNEKNEFPKRIVYMKTDNGIEAVISGGGMEIPFFFVPRAQ